MSLQITLASGSRRLPHLVLITGLCYASFASRCPAQEDGDFTTKFVTYLGGAGEDWILDVSTDIVGGREVITVAGITAEGSFSFLGDRIQAGNSDAFVERLSGDGRESLWRRTLGGSGVDGALALDVAEDGSVAVTGWASAGFPATDGAYDSTHNGRFNLDIDAFVALLDADGEVTYATVIGGEDEDMALDVAMDSRGAVTVFGHTASVDFPVAEGAFQDERSGGLFDGFVARINPSRESAEQLEYSTFLGGGGEEAPTIRFLERAGHKSLKLLDDEAVLLTGETSSWDYPTTTEEPVRGGFDVHVTVLRCSVDVDPEEQLVFSTTLGGGSWDLPYSVAIEDEDQIVVSGITWSNDFPVTANAFRRTHQSGGADGDAFLVRLNLSADPGGQLTYGTYFGGAGNDLPEAIGIVKAGIVAVGGMTFSPDFPGVRGQLAARGGIDAFLFVLDMNGSSPADQLIHSSLFGGASLEEASALAVAGNDIIIGGVTLSADLPVSPTALKQQKSGTSDAFVVRYRIGPDEHVRFLRGDCDAGGTVDISDAVCILNWLFSGAGAPGCVAATNTNGDNATDVSDATYLLNHLFADGSAPAQPFPDCGPGELPADARLGCSSPPDCQ